MDILQELNRQYFIKTIVNVGLQKNISGPSNILSNPFSCRMDDDDLSTHKKHRRPTNWYQMLLNFGAVYPKCM